MTGDKNDWVLIHHLKIRGKVLRHLGLGSQCKQSYLDLEVSNPAHFCMHTGKSVELESELMFSSRLKLIQILKQKKVARTWPWGQRSCPLMYTYWKIGGVGVKSFHLARNWFRSWNKRSSLWNNFNPKSWLWRISISYHFKFQISAESEKLCPQAFIPFFADSQQVESNKNAPDLQKKIYRDFKVLAIKTLIITWYEHYVSIKVLFWNKEITCKTYRMSQGNDIFLLFLCIRHACDSW